MLYNCCNRELNPFGHNSDVVIWSGGSIFLNEEVEYKRECPAQIWPPFLQYMASNTYLFLFNSHF